MPFDMATLNTRVNWPATTSSSLGWFRDNTKPAYRTYGLNNMAGYYWYQSNLSGSAGWQSWNCGSFECGMYDAYNCGDAPYTQHSVYLTVAGPNCCQDQAPPLDNCVPATVNACGNCYLLGWNFTDNCRYYGAGAFTGNCQVNFAQCVYYFDGACGTAQCAQCSVQGNCDSRAWMQPNCNCIQCNCACNCAQAGQCTQLWNCACDCYQGS